MHCPFCQTEETKVIDSRLIAEGEQVRRRRECIACNQRFTTHEMVELTLPSIVKKNGNRETFNESKLRSGLQRALEKRPVATEQLETALVHIKQALRTGGEREVDSRKVGELVMDELRNLDQVAYVRFASVYRRFKDLEEFRSEIDRLEQQKSSDDL